MAKAPTQIRSLARSHTETAVNVLVGIMQEPKAPPAARVSAAQVLLDRGWGKPAQPLVGDDEHDAITLKVIERVITDATNPDSKSIPPATGTGEV